MPQLPELNKSRLQEISVFLEKTSETNESTEYSADQDYIVESIITLAKLKGSQEMISEFDTPYIHHMVTIQKWVEELKLLADEALNEINSGNENNLS